jgi:type I restriction enzyme S subunit
MEWREDIVGNYVSIKHGFAFKGEYFSDEGEYIVLTPGNIQLEGGLKLTGKEKSYSDEFPQSFIFEEGDLVVVMTDLIQDAPILGGALLIPESNKFLHNQRLGKVEIKGEADKKFLYYYLNSEYYRGQVRATATGATVRHTAPERIYQCKIKLPPPHIQRRVAEVLGRYDALIENYQRQIGILEASAQALYREWFVRERIKYEGAEQNLGEIATETRRIVKAQNLEPGTPYVGLEHLSIKSIVIRGWGTAEDVESDKLSFEKNEILFGKIRPYLHKVCLSHFAGICSSDAIVIKPVIEHALSFILFTVFDEKFIEFADKISNGTKMPRAEWSVLKTYKVFVPSEDVLAAFEKLVLPMLSKLENLQSQITILRQMRDKLLPRLLSEQIPLTAAE